MTVLSGVFIVFLVPTLANALLGLSSVKLPFLGLGSKDSLKWNTIKVRYPTLLIDGYYTVPLSTSEIKNNEYVFMKKHEKFADVSLYCYPNDPRVCFFYDKYGKIAGLRTAYIKEDIPKKAGGTLDNFPYSYKKPIFQEGNDWGKEFYYIDTLFVSPESLAKGGPAQRDEAVGDGVYLNIDGAGWKKVPRKESEVTADTGFTKQACFSGMGIHYFYKMTKQLECNDHQPPFLLYNSDGDQIGFGLVPFGASTPEKGSRTWFESPPAFAIKSIVPNGPTCLPDWIGKYGGVSLHVFFIQCPRMTCPLSFFG